MTDDRDDELPTVPRAEVERRAARGGAVTAASQALKSGIEGLGVLYLARALTPADFGMIDMIVSVTGVIDLLKDFGLSSAVIQKERLDRAQANVLFWINTGIGAGLTLLTALLSPLLALGYGRPELLQLTLALSLSSLLGGVAIQQQALLRRNLEFRRLAIVDVVSVFCSMGLACAAAYAHWGPWALVVRQLSRLGTQALVTWCVSPWKPGRFRAANVRDFVRMGTHVSGFQLLNFTERNLDNVLIGRFAGPTQLGFYTRAYDVMRFPLNLVNVPIATVAVPALSRLAHDPERYRTVYRALTRLLLLATVPLGPLFILIADPVLPLLLGERWSGALTIVRWLSAGLLLKPLVFTGSWLLVSQGRTSELFRWGAFACFVAVASFFAGLPWGAEGVAASYTLTDLLFRGPIMLYWVARTGPVRVRDLLYCLLPAWTCAAAEVVAFYVLSSLLHSLPDRLRVLTCGPLALAIGFATVLATRAGRSAVRDGLSFLRTVRSRS